MIKDRTYWTAWEAQGPLREPADFARNLRLLEAMLAHARSLGAFPPPDPLEGLEVRIRMARVLNVRTTTGTTRPRA